MNVLILIRYIPYEGGDVLGAFADNDEGIKLATEKVAEYASSAERDGKSEGPTIPRAWEDSSENEYMLERMALAGANPNTLTGTLYAVDAVKDGKQLPTFFLDANVQGIVSTGQGCDIAHQIVGNSADVTVARL